MDAPRTAARRILPEAEGPALRRWLALHAAYALLAAVGVAAAGRATGAGASDIGAPALLTELVEARPDVVLLGNSMLHDGVNADLLDELLRGEPEAGTAPRDGPRTFKHGVGGVTSAYWYLYVKNCLAVAETPRLVVIPFRDPFLTYATFRIYGPYAELIARVSRPDEPGFERVVALNTSGAGDLGDRSLALLRRLVPAYAARDRVGDAIWRALKTLPAQVLPGALPAYEQAVGEVLPARAFAAAEGGGQAPGVFDTATAGGGTPVVGVVDEGHPFGAIDNTPWSRVYDTLDYLRFPRVVDSSFLPLIVEQCRDRGVQLALLRLRKGPSPDWSDLVPEELLAAYGRDIDAWLAAHDVILLDTTQDAALTPALFRSPDHLNEAGREHLTIKIAEWLEAWWAREGASLRADVEPAEAWPDAARRQALEAEFARVLQRPDDARVREAPVEWPLPPQAIERVRTQLHRVQLPDWIAADGDTDADTERSRWELLEDGRRLGPAHALLPTIAKFGAGRYAHRGGELYFSASDDSSPCDNGRSYVLRKRRLSLVPER